MSPLFSSMAKTAVISGGTAIATQIANIVIRLVTDKATEDDKALASGLVKLTSKKSNSLPCKFF